MKVEKLQEKLLESGYSGFTRQNMWPWYHKIELAKANQYLYTPEYTRYLAIANNSKHYFGEIPNIIWKENHY